MARRIMEKRAETRALAEQISKTTSAVELYRLKLNLKQLEEQKKQLQEEARETGDNVRRLVGEGNREYLTGLKLGGKRILILLDVSGSMLDDTIVNVIRIRNMRDGIKRNAPKWVQALRMVEWLTARFPMDSQYQVYVFNAATRPLLPGKSGNWLDVSNRAETDALIKALGKATVGPGVLVNCGAPAAVETDLCTQVSQAHIEMMRSKIPMGRFGTVEEVANIIAWLCSSECSFQTGAVFDVSGGRATY